MRHELPPLPFPRSALGTLMSEETLEYHHGKHHKAYVEKTNELLRGTGLENLSLEELVRKSSGSLFNNAAQAWNHAFFWQCLTPERGSKPGAELIEAIERDFGSVDGFLSRFRKEAIAHFGSGWIWLVRDESGGKLAIETTANADTPIRSWRTPLLTCDLWEHAYYIDYRNERPRFVDAFVELANWEFASRNLRSAWQLAA